MAQYLSFVTTLATAGILAAVPASASRQVNLSTPDDPPADCNRIQMSSSGYETALAEEMVDAGGDSLRVSPGGNGGVWISGADAPAFSVRACKYAMGRDRQEAEAQLGEIHVVNTSGEITARGPSGGRWAVFFVVQAPRGASVTAETRNGPISVRGVNGTVVARATNGPISIHESQGHLEAETRNGPISIDDASGDVKATAENGPLTVRLRGTEWQGEGLDGRTTNGPLTLLVPSGYGSGVVVEADGRSPFTCRVCSDAQRTWDDQGRRVQLGSGAERVRLRTTNGPVTVKN
jgi:hypothetical protein